MASPRRDAVIDTLRQRFLSAAHLGLLKPGDKLPSAREVALELGVDRRVVLAAFRFLEREGVLALRERSGIYFAPAAAPHAGLDARRVEWVSDFVAEGVSRGVPVHALADEVHRAVSTLRLRAACVECNDDQIDALCAELRGDYGLEASGVALDPLRDASALLGADEECEDEDLDASRAPAALRRADVLITTPFHASDVKLVAERLRKPWLVVDVRADVFAELARLLERGPAFAVVADHRFARKLELIYRSTAGARHFRALVAGRDDLTQLPAGAPTYVTRLARERLAGTVLPIHEIPAVRGLSAASTRDVVAFIVRANMEAIGGRSSG